MVKLELFESVFNINQLDSPMNLIFNHKRKMLDTEYEFKLDSEEKLVMKPIFIGDKNDELGRKHGKLRYTYFRKRLLWSPILRESLRKPFVNLLEAEDFESYICKYISVSLCVSEFYESEYLYTNPEGLPHFSIADYCFTEPDGVIDIHSPEKLANITPTITLDELITTNSYEDFEILACKRYGMDYAWFD